MSAVVLHLALCAPLTVEPYYSSCFMLRLKLEDDKALSLFIRDGWDKACLNYAKAVRDKEHELRKDLRAYEIERYHCELKQGD